MIKEEHIAYVRNEARSKVEIVFVKGGWTEVEKPEEVQDVYILRLWVYKEGNTVTVTNIRLSAKEMQVLQKQLAYWMEKAIEFNF